MSTVRLTVGQAIVRFLAQQYVERDGEQNRFIAGVWGIFGHGNVAGLGQALEELGDEYDMPYYRPQNEQATGPHRDRLRKAQEPAADVRLHLLHRSRRHEHDHRRRDGDRQPPARSCSSRRDYFANRLADPVLQQVEHPVEHDVSASDAFRPVSRYFDRISRPSSSSPACPRRFRVLTDPAETGAVTISLPEDVQAEVYDWPERFFEKRVWRVRRPRPEAELVDEVVDLIRSRQAAAHRRRRRRHLRRRRGRAGRARRPTYGIPVSESQAGKGVLPWNHPGTWVRSGPPAVSRPTGWRRTPTSSSASAPGSATSSPPPRPPSRTRTSAFVGINVNGVRCRQDALRAARRRRARGAGALARGLARSRHPRHVQGTGSRSQRSRPSGTSASPSTARPAGETADLAQPEVIGIVNDAIGGHATRRLRGRRSLPGDLLKLWRPEDSKAYHLEYGYSCMGYEIAGRLGVKMAEPGREVVRRDRRRHVPDAQLPRSSPRSPRASSSRSSSSTTTATSASRTSPGPAGVPQFGNELRFRDSGTAA